MNNITIAIKRSAAAVIDFMLMAALVLIVIKVLGLDFESVLASAWTANIIGFGSLFILEAILMASWGKTPGMALLGLSVKNQDGAKLPFGKSLLRSLLIFVLGIATGSPRYGLFGIALGTNLIIMIATGKTLWDFILHTAVNRK